ALVPIAAAQAQTPVRPGSSPEGSSPDPDAPRPIDAVDSVFIEELTWMEVRDAMRGGKTTVIIATGGVEMNGPYLATGKHNYILRSATEAIARKLGNALVAPVVAFVPEGNIDPPTGMMRYPGTISLQEDTYKRLLTDIASCFRTHGFEHIILIGDSGGNQAGMKEVAESLAARWKGGKTSIHYIPEYYDYPGLTKWLETQGIREVDEGLHDDFGISAMVMTVDPDHVRIKQRLARGKATINGVPLHPVEKAVEFGKKAVDYRADVTVTAIRKVLAR
ncbi:MAG: creatininase family protein, partial [Acidobacteria bacterium]|nr:creatininase family protein [Acidobacteriota bacterium]